MRFAAPQDVSDITLSSGPLPVVDGHIDVPDAAGAGDLASLAAYGFTPAPATPAPRAAGKAAPAPDASAQ